MPWILVAAAGVALSLAGCGDQYDRPSLSARVVNRTGFAVGSPPRGGQVFMPNGVSLADGLAEDEAVLIALWNNAAFQEVLYDLDISRSDLAQAHLLPNPELAYYTPGHAKPFKYLLDLPLEALWLKPIRIAAAKRQAARTTERLTQRALDLIRDVRRGYAAVLLAQGSLEVANAGVDIRGRIAAMATERLKAGDISVQEEAAARIDALKARQDQVRASYEVSLAEERLRHLLGIGTDRSPLRLDPTPAPIRSDLHADALVSEASRTRPDILAAEQAVAAAAEQVRLSQVGWVRLLGIYDATSGSTGHQPSPGLRVTLPIFNWNQGGVSRAEAELEKARRQCQTIGDQVILDIRQAHLRYSQSRAELELLDQKVLPEADKALQRTQKAYRAGDVPYLIVLESMRQLLDGRLRRQQLLAELRQAWAELERSVGRRLTAAQPSAPAAAKGQVK